MTCHTAIDVDRDHLHDSGQAENSDGDGFHHDSVLLEFEFLEARNGKDVLS